MDDPRREVKDAVDEAVQNLKTMVDRRPDAAIRADVFNMLLDQAKRLFPDSEVIKQLQPIKEGALAADLMMGLSALAGAIKTAFRVKPAGAFGQIQTRRAYRSPFLDR
jgi:hypothetical protein